MKRCVFYFFILTCLVSISPHGEPILCQKSKDSLVIIVQNIPYPAERLEKELKSGLPTTISYSIRLFSDGNVKREERLIITVVYDLWDEIFHLKRITPEGLIKQKFTSEKELLAVIKKLEYTDLIYLNELIEGKKYVVEVSIVLNPVAHEKILKIQKWVADHGVTYIKQTTPDGNENTFSSTGPRFKSLFDTIFEQYTNQDKEIGFWKTSLKSRPFQLGDLTNEQ